MSEYCVNCEAMAKELEIARKRPCVAKVIAGGTCVYLTDGTKIVVRRDKKTRGPAWLEVQPQAKLYPAEGT